MRYGGVNTTVGGRHELGRSRNPKVGQMRSVGKNQIKARSQRLERRLGSREEKITNGRIGGRNIMLTKPIIGLVWITHYNFKK